MKNSQSLLERNHSAFIGQQLFHIIGEEGKIEQLRNRKITALVLFCIALSAAFFANVPLAHGLVWSPDMRITWNITEDRYPSAAQALDGKIWYAWHSYRTGDYEVFYKVYDPTQAHPWSDDVQLTNTPNYDILPSVLQTADNKTWIAWTTRRNGNWDIYYKIFNGATWTDDTGLVTGSGDDDSPSLLQTANGTIWLFWSSKRTGNKEIFLMTSSNNGASWGNPLQVTSTANQDSGDPDVTQSSDGRIWLVFARNYNILYRTSLNGVSWTSESTLTSAGNNLHPSIVQAADGDIWLVWDSDRVPGPVGELQNDIFYRLYSGGSWGAETPFTTTTSEQDDMPSIMRLNDGNLTVSWSATRGGMHDIYYRSTAPLPLHDVGVFYLATSKSIVALNRVVAIDYVAQNHGANAETFTVNLYANSTLLRSAQVSGLAPGDLYPLSFDWNTSGSALGNYTIMANATVVSGETNTGDNEHVDGVVWVVVHDVAVTGMSVPVRIAYPGYTYFRAVYVNVTNKGTLSENVTVMAMYNSSVIGIQTVTLGRNENATLMFLLNTFSMSYSNNTITVEATPIVDEDNQTDNSMGGGYVLVTVPGDANGDKRVDILDWSTLSAHWYPGPPVGPLGYGETADINDDGEVNILDMAILSSRWGFSW